MTQIMRKRVYDEPAASDGCRVLVDRVWPRGRSRRDARVDLWLRELAPSNELRRWFAHDPARWGSFRERYRQELSAAPEALRNLLALCRRGPVTLLYGARDRTHNNAVVLHEVLLEELAAEAPEAASPVCYAAMFERDDRKPR